MDRTNPIWNQVLDQQKIIAAPVPESQNSGSEPVDAPSENGYEAGAEVAPTNLTTPTGQQQRVAPGPPHDDVQSSALRSGKASAAQEFPKKKPRKARRTDSSKLHRVKHGMLAREALA